MNLKEYYNKIYTLSFIHRYTNIPRICNEDVAQHSFFVAAIILKLHEEYEFDLGKSLQAAISHDITEADLSDVTHEVKRRYPDLAKELKKAEHSAVLRYPPAVIEGYLDFDAEDSVESIIANYADVLQVQQYIDNEIALGNTEVDDIDISTRMRRWTLKKELMPYVRPKENS